MKNFSILGSNNAAQLFRSRLLAAGFEVGSSTAGGTPEFVGLQSVMLLPRDIMESEALLFERENLARSAPDLEVIALAATLSPRYVKALRARIDRRIDLIDAPFSGTVRAGSNDLPSFLLGGSPQALDRLRPVFDALGQANTTMGIFGTATAAKALQDCLTAASSAMARSAFDWAEAQGIEETRLVGLLETAFGKRMQSAISDPAGIVTNTLPGDNAGAILVKNVEAALDTALAGVHLNPPKNFHQVLASVRARLLH